MLLPVPLVAESEREFSIPWEYDAERAEGRRLLCDEEGACYKKILLKYLQSYKHPDGDAKSRFWNINNHPQMTMLTVTNTFEMQS